MNFLDSFGLMGLSSSGTPPMSPGKEKRFRFPLMTKYSVSIIVMRILDLLQFFEIDDTS